MNRRDVLIAGLTVGIATLAGCSANGREQSNDQSSPPGTQTTASGSVVETITYETTDMVVKLTDDHAVSRLNLIAPDGQLFKQASVATGASTVRIRILDIKPEGGDFEHYQPGTYELVAVSESGSESIDLELQPVLRIVDISQYREGSQANDYGKLAVEVENVGTAPTWVYDITNEGAPNFAANAEISNNPGVPLLEYPKSTSEMIIPPKKKQVFVGVTLPLVFSDQKNPTCNTETEMAVIVGSPSGDVLEQPIRTESGGQVTPAGLTGEYTCTDVSVELVG